MSVEDTEAGRALRALQRYDQRVDALGSRYLMIAAEDALGELLGLECTGEPGMWNDDGSVAGYDHNGDTCPVHEWLVETDGDDELALEDQRLARSR